MRIGIAIPALAVLATLAACQPAAAPQAGGAAMPENEALAFAQGACGSCHAVEPNALSPVVEAPEWPAIVNQPGLNADTLGTWLRDAHNYPEEMDFDLTDEQVDLLADYMLTLQSEDYHPPI